MDKVNVEGKAGVSNAGLKNEQPQDSCTLSHKDLGPNGPRTTSVDFRIESGLVQEEKSRMDHMA